MTISKERMNEIALEVGKGFIREMEGYAYFGSNPGIPQDDIADFLHAAIKAVEAEQKVVAKVRDTFDGYTDILKLEPLNSSMRLIALPLVSEE